MKQFCQQTVKQLRISSTDLAVDPG